MVLPGIAIYIEVPPTDKPLYVAIAPMYPAYEIYVNGTRIGSFGGNLGEAFGQHFARPASFPLPRSASRYVIAIRSSELFLNVGRQGGSAAAGTSWIGTEDSVAGKVAVARLDRIERSSWMRLLCAGLVFGGLFFVLMSLTRQGDREFLWCGLLLVAAAMNRI